MKSKKTLAPPPLQVHMMTLILSWEATFDLASPVDVFRFCFGAVETKAPHAEDLI